MNNRILAFRLADTLTHHFAAIAYEQEDSGQVRSRSRQQSLRFLLSSHSRHKLRKNSHLIRKIQSASNGRSKECKRRLDMENLKEVSKEVSSEDFYLWAVSVFYCGVLLAAFVIGLFGLYNLLELTTTAAAQNIHPAGLIN